MTAHNRDESVGRKAARKHKTKTPEAIQATIAREFETIRGPTELKKIHERRKRLVNLYQQIYMFATVIFESIYSDVADQIIRLNAIACPKTNNSLQ
jgi:hypothetical protein